MARCLNCNYELIFLERRHKYKCAKCSRLFTEEEIKLEEFKRHNKSERKKEKGIIEDEKNRRKKADPNYSKKYYQNNREELLENARKYHLKHRDEILKRKKERYKAGEHNEIRKIRRKDNIELTRINGRIEYWKRKQKVIAESRFNEFLLCGVNKNPKEILPTLVLA